MYGFKRQALKLPHLQYFANRYIYFLKIITIDSKTKKIMNKFALKFSVKRVLRFE